MSYVAANGQEFTDDMIDRWCDAYEQGEFPEGERTRGKVMMGRPPLSSDKTTTLTVKIPVGMKAAMVRNAKEHGQTLSTYARALLTEGLMAVE